MLSLHVSVYIESFEALLLYLKVTALGESLVTKHTWPHVVCIYLPLPPHAVVAIGTDNRLKMYEIFHMSIILWCKPELTNESKYFIVSLNSADKYRNMKAVVECDIYKKNKC